MPRRIGFYRAQRRVVAVDRGAIRTDGIFRISQINEDMRMIEWAAGADAFELADTDLNPINARIILKMRYNPL